MAAAAASTKPEEVVTLFDGGIVKKILKAGTGEATPPVGADVEVHYTGTLLDGSKFDSSRDRNEPFNFKIGKGQVIKGWDSGVATMKKGERAILTCRADFAYGANGSPPKIPPNATLNFDVELLSWTKKQKVTDDKQVMKEIIKAGDGYNRPNDGARVTIRYSARVAGAAQPFIDHMQSPAGGVTLVVGADWMAPEGFDECLKNLLKGEHSTFTVAESYGYGTVIPAELKAKVPADSALEYEIELLDFEKGKETWDMSADEKLAFATTHKNAGNEFYKRGLNERAVKRYNAGLAPFKYEAQFSDLPAVMKQMHELKVTINSNLAAVKYKQKDFKGVETACTDALAIDSKHVKSLYRRAQVAAQMDEFDRALTDLALAHQLEPANADVTKLHAAVLARVQARKQKERDMWRGAFGKVNLVTAAEVEQNKKRAEAEAAKQKAEMEDANSEPDVATPIPVPGGSGSGNNLAAAAAAIAKSVDADLTDPVIKPAAKK